MAGRSSGVGEKQLKTASALASIHFPRVSNPTQKLHQTLRKEWFVPGLRFHSQFEQLKRLKHQASWSGNKKLPSQWQNNPYLGYLIQWLHKYRLFTYLKNCNLDKDKLESINQAINKHPKDQKLTLNSQ